MPFSSYAMPHNHDALLPKGMQKREGERLLFVLPLPLFMFLVLGTDYVDVTFSADGLFGEVRNRVFVLSFFLMMLREGMGWDFGLMGKWGRAEYVPCTRHTSS